MTTRIANASARAAVNAVAALLNGGTLRIYTGTRPADPDDAATGTLVATLTLGSPAFAAAVQNGDLAEATANAITGDTAADANGPADANGLVGYYRGSTSGGATVVEGLVAVSGTTAAATAQLILSAAPLQNGPVNVSSWVLRMGEG